jgi:diguanylate cyclase (GGDEF)-like protein
MDEEQIVVANAARGQQVPALASLLDNGLRDVLEHVMAASAHGAASGYLTNGGQVYLVASDAFRNENTEAVRADRSVLVFAKSLDADFVDAIADTYRLPGLALTGRDEATAKLRVSDLAGHTVSALTWPESRPSAEHLPKLLAAMLGVFVIAIFLIRYFLADARRAQRDYEEKLYALATRDYLTGISNRREFMHLAERELRRAYREGHDVSVLWLDIDRFKRINDRFGHEAGDEALRSLATTVSHDLRDFDIFARIGGEEFAIILHNSGIEQGYELAERLRQRIAQQGVPLAGGESLSFTASFGVAPWYPGETIDAVLTRADRALYAAKEAGRNVSQKASPARQQSLIRARGTRPGRL